MDINIISFDIELATFFVQLVSTLVLFFIVSKFAVKPMKKFLADREALIAAEFEAAEVAKSEAENARNVAQGNIKDAKENAQQIIETAKNEADVKHRVILEKARRDAEVEMKKAQEEIKRERQNMYDTARKEIAEIATSATEKLIKKEIDANAHDDLFAEFVGLVGGNHE